MPVLDIKKDLASQAIIDAGNAVDRLKRIAVESLIEAKLLDEDGSPIRAYEAVKNLSLHLSLVAEAMMVREVEREMERRRA